jgi:16S rRNA (cytosine1402-N4)-methyltransferase
MFRSSQRGDCKPQHQPEGIYVDCTFGGGGHSKTILQQLNEKGKLVAFDQDADAKRNLPKTGDCFCSAELSSPPTFPSSNGIEEVDGVLADLGVSSHQFDEASRGFSTRYEANL